MFARVSLAALATAAFFFTPSPSLQGQGTVPHAQWHVDGDFIDHTVTPLDAAELDAFVLSQI
jgi:hypothetical protein